MDLKERSFVEKSGHLELKHGCPNGLYLAYVETNGAKKIRILDGPVGIGVSVDFEPSFLMPLISELLMLYNQLNLSPNVEFEVAIKRRSDESEGSAGSAS